MLRCATGRIALLALERPPASGLDTAAFEEPIDWDVWRRPPTRAAVAACRERTRRKGG